MTEAFYPCEHNRDPAHCEHCDKAAITALKADVGRLEGYKSCVIKIEDMFKGSGTDDDVPSDIPNHIKWLTKRLEDIESRVAKTCLILYRSDDEVRIGLIEAAQRSENERKTAEAKIGKVREVCKWFGASLKIALTDNECTAVAKEYLGKFRAILDEGEGPS